MNKRVIPSAHFTWEADDFAGAIGATEPGGNIKEALKTRTFVSTNLRRSGTLGYGDTPQGPPGVRQSKRRRETRWARCLYLMERLMSEHGRKIQIPMLFFVGFVQVVIFGLVWSLVWRYDEGKDPRPRARVSRFIEGFWASWTFMADGGTHAIVYHAEQRFVGGFITVFGIIYLAAVLAFIVDMVRERMDSMRVGKGQVYESRHTVILHWTDRTIPLIQELCIANESSGGGVIVILAKESMETMSGDLATQLPKSARHGTKIVCRHGNPAVVSDLLKVSADRARAVIILAEATGADESDSGTLRCILSITSLGFNLSGHLVAEVCDVDNEPLLQLVGGKHIETFVSHDVLGRLMLMSVRQKGLASVYDTMLGFEGNEFYMKPWPELKGLAFGELLERFPEAIPIGLRMASGVVHLNPAPDMCLCDGDELIVIAEDGFSYRPEQPVRVETGKVPPLARPLKRPEKVLICGWRRDIRDILILLDKVVVAGSQVHTMTHSVPAELRNDQLLDEGLRVDSLKNITLVHHFGNTSIRRRLEILPLQEFTSCMIFADQSYEEDSMQADSHSLATLVLIRDIQARRQELVTCPITCEILDTRTQQTISGERQLAMMSDFVQSNQFVARVLGMIGEERSVKPILNELLGAIGASLFIVPSAQYVEQNEYVSFWTVAKRVSARNAVLLGYQHQGVGSKRYTELNPPDKDVPKQWAILDLAIIAANDTFDVDHTASETGGDELRTLEDELGTELTAAGPPHRCLEMRGDSKNLDVPEEAGICASADTAASAMVKLAAGYAEYMSEEETFRYARYLSAFGASLQKGVFPSHINAM